MSTSDMAIVDPDARIRDRVREVLAETLVMDAGELPDDTSQQTCARWTSLYHMMLLVVIEEQFGVSLSLDEMTTMTSIASIVSILKGHGVDA